MEERKLDNLKKGDLLQIPIGENKIYGLFEVKSTDINEVKLQLSSYLNFYKYEVEDKMKNGTLDTFISDAPMTFVRLFEGIATNDETVSFKYCEATLLKSFLKKRNDINIVPKYISQY